MTRTIRAALASIAANPMFVGCTCSKVDPEPMPASSSAAPSAAASAPSAERDAEALPPVVAHSGKLERDPDGGHLKPTTPRPSEDPAMLPPKPQREPDFDLDPLDPARDYVTRYVRATKRYGDKTECVAYGASFDKGQWRAVEVKDDPKSSCGGSSDALRDTFLVDVGADKMTLDDPKAKPLANWPDGSDPRGKPSPIPSQEDWKKFASPLVDELVKSKLTVVRVQLYGRGTYPVLTLAGWRDPMGANASPESLLPLTQKLCQASENKPFSVFAGINRSTILRVRCPSGQARWDKL